MSSPAEWPPACTEYNPNYPSQYGYRPNLGLSVAFVIIFGLICIAHGFQMWRYRTPWMIFFVVGSGLESLGWIARAVGHTCSYSRPLFTMQTAVLIMGPAWTQAGIYITLWVIIVLLGRHVSPLPPRTYLLICACVDIVCLALQATGGGLAGAAYQAGKSTQPGTTTMVVGIIAQLVLTCIFSCILAIVVWRGAPQIRTNKPMFRVVGVTILAAAMMIMRGVYRSIELAEGWRGKLITVEVYVVVLDAVPMIIAMGAYVFTPPAKLLRDQGASMKIDGTLIKPRDEVNMAAEIGSRSGSGTDAEKEDVPVVAVR